MSAQNNGGPAFPCFRAEGPTMQDGWPEWPAETIPGMTLRDYFAAKAMQGMVASEWMAAHTNAIAECDADFHRGTWVAAQAYAFADAMLAARGDV